MQPRRGRRVHVLLALLLLGRCTGEGELEKQPEDKFWETNYQTITTIECLTTAKPDPFTIEVRHEWSPLGADRFVDMVEKGFFEDISLFRVDKNFIVQTGLRGDPSMESKRKFWDLFPVIPDDHPVPRIPFKSGMVSFAGGGKDTRTTSFFIAFKDSVHLGGSPWETPFGMVVKNMDEVVREIYGGYGEMQPFNPKGINQSKINEEGNEYLKREFPLIDYIKSCKVIGEPRQNIRKAAEAAAPAVVPHDDGSSSSSGGAAVPEKAASATTAAATGAGSNRDLRPAAAGCNDGDAAARAQSAAASGSSDVGAGATGAAAPSHDDGGGTAAADNAAAVVAAQAALARYALARGAVAALCTALAALHARSAALVGDAAGLATVARLMELLDAMATFAVQCKPQGTGAISDDALTGGPPPPQPPVPLEQAVVAGLKLPPMVTLLMALLMGSERGSATHASAAAADDGGGGNSTASSRGVLLVMLPTLHCVSSLAQLNLGAVQDALASQAARTEFLALSDRLLAALAAATAADGGCSELEGACLRGLLVVLGQFALCCPRNQDMLLWGAPPTPLVRLCRLPYSYFSEEDKRRALLPTLVAAAFRHERARDVVGAEVSTRLLRDCVSTAIMDAVPGAPARARLAPRFPPHLWNEAVEFFS